MPLAIRTIDRLDELAGDVQITTPASGHVLRHNGTRWVNVDGATDWLAQYVAVDGRSGGQQVTGGTGSAQDLTLLSTSHATKGSVLIGSPTLAEFDSGNSLFTLSGGNSAQAMRVVNDQGQPAGSDQPLVIADFLRSSVDPEGVQIGYISRTAGDANGGFVRSSGSADTLALGNTSKPFAIVVRQSNLFFDQSTIAPNSWTNATVVFTDIGWAKELNGMQNNVNGPLIYRASSTSALFGAGAGDLYIASRRASARGIGLLTGSADPPLLRLGVNEPGFITMGNEISQNGVCTIMRRSSGANVYVMNRDSTTTAVVTTLSLYQESSGTPAAGLGVAMRFGLHSSTTKDVDAALISAEWVSATHASRTTRMKMLAYDTCAREGVRIEADGSAPRLGFYGASAVAKQTITGSRANTEQALAGLLTALAGLGLITDSTTT